VVLLSDTVVVGTTSTSNTYLFGTLNLPSAQIDVTGNATVNNITLTGATIENSNLVLSINGHTYKIQLLE